MPAAQSFIQILGTFLARLFIFIASLFCYIKLAPLTIKQLKPLVALDLSLKNPTSFIRKEMSKINKVKNLSHLLCFINFQIYFLLIT